MDYRERKTFELNNAYCKVLETVNFLNNLNYFPNAHGIGKILNGEVDSETKELKNCPTFGSFISVGGRKCCAMVTQLVRHELLKYSYEEKVDDLFLKITNKGVTVLENFKKHHKVIYKKKEKIKEITIFKK